MSICTACYGVIGRDCWNPQECAEITAQMQFEPTHPASTDSAAEGGAWADEIAWLREAARYFAARSTGGEDRAHWANIYNAENANKLADRLALLSSNTGGQQ